MKVDYYEILQVTKTSSDGEIKTAYRKLAMQFHPDRNPGDKSAEDKFKECSEAYEILCDPQKRQRYDQFGHQGVSGQHDFSHMDISDIFSMFGEIFGGGIAPSIAGYVAQHYGIQNVLYLALVGVALGIIVCLFLKETAPRKVRRLTEPRLEAEASLR